MYYRIEKYVWADTNYQGEIEYEDEEKVVVKYFYNWHSGEGYWNYMIPKRYIINMNK